MVYTAAAIPKSDDIVDIDDIDDSAHFDSSLYPRWPLAPIRWQRTRVSVWQSWCLYFQLVPRFRDHTVFEFLTDLPGQDDVMVARVPFLRYVVVRSPELARYVLINNQDNYRKSAEYDMLAVATGRGPVTDLNDQTWERKRRLVQPIFAKRKVEGFHPQITAAANDAVSRWLELRSATAEMGAGIVDISAEMNRLTSDVIARTMFGTTMSGPMADVRLARLLRFFGIGFVTSISRPLRAVATWLSRRARPADDAVNTRLSIRVLRLMSWVVAPHVMLDLRHAERVVDQLIADHRTGRITNKENLLAALIEARDPETGDCYSDREIHDELMGFLTAGMETTATALTWTWKLLAEHPEVRARLHNELRDVLDGRTPTGDDLDNLPWTRAVVAETMRLYPPIVAVARVAKRDDVIGDFPIKAGTTVAILMHGIHNNRRVWERCQSFDPSRYLAENMNRLQKQASMPFGAGRKICVASGFAAMEAALIVATIAQRVDLQQVQQNPIVRQNSFTGGPAGPVLMQPHARAICTSTSLGLCKSATEPVELWEE